MNTTVSSLSDVPGSVPGGSLFVREAGLLLPTDLARGPWRPDALHGGAVAALLACGVDLPGRTVVRLMVDLLGPVPAAPLRLVASAAVGGDRVARQTVSLFSGDAEVATAQCLGVRLADLELPPPSSELPDPFAAAMPPRLTDARPAVAELVGWDCFDSGAICVRRLRDPLPDYATGVYVNLLVPVLAGEDTPPLARAAAAADYASNHLASRFNFDAWSFMNADLTLHLSRTPAAGWIGLASTGFAAPNGSGLSVAQLFDSRGRIGQSVQSLVVESRGRARAAATTASSP